jgi:hypothetical protein
MQPSPHRRRARDGRRARLASLTPVLALALTPAAAEGMTLVSPGGDAKSMVRYQRWVDKAGVPTPPGAVNLVLQGCPLAAEPGCIVHGLRPTIYLGRAVQDRATLLHEVGHAFDAAVLDDGDRAAFAAITGDRRGWRSPPNSPHEQFAEAYALCALKPKLSRNHTAAYAYRATPAQHRRVCRLIKRAAR